MVCVMIGRCIEMAICGKATIQRLLLVTGLSFIPMFGFAEDTAMPVVVVKVVIAPVYEELPLSGTVVSPRVSRISPKVEGLVAEVLVEAGDQVKAGDPLVLLDPVMAEIELTRVKAEVNEAQARLNEAIRQRHEGAELVEKKHIPFTTYAALIAEVEIQTAALQKLKADHNRQIEVLERHRVSAPFDGVISKKLVESGQWVETSDAVTELVQISVLRVDVPVPQHYFSHIEVGTPVSIRFDAIPNRDFTAQVSSKVPVGHKSARTFPVRIDIQNSDRLIAPGMSARVHIRISKSITEQAVLLPRLAVMHAPTPLPQTTIPLSASPERTAPATAEAKSG